MYYPDMIKSELPSESVTEPKAARPSFFERHPVWTSVLSIVVLVLAYGVSGAVLMRRGIADISPVLVPNLVIGLGIVAYLAIRRRQRELFWQRPQGFAKAAWVYGALGVILLMTAVGSWISAGGFQVDGPGRLGYYLLLALGVGLLEELLFRGILVRAWMRKGERFAVVVSSVLFGVVHLSQLMGGQTGVLTILQIVFAAVWGFAMANLVVASRSVWFAVAFHALYDFVQLITTSPNAANTESALDVLSLVNDAVQIALLLGVGILLWRSRRR